VTPETLVEELVPLSAEYDGPIAVVDEQGHLLGEVHRAAVLTSLTVSTVAERDDENSTTPVAPAEE
jgi:CBS-domain-containing membrane protein